MDKPSRVSLLALIAVLFSLSTALSQSFIRLDAEVENKAAFAQATSTRLGGSLNINNLWLKVWWDGTLGPDTARHWGLTYPLYNGGLLLRDNLVWVGQVDDGGSPSLRTGGGTYLAGVQPGSIISRGVSEDPNSESVRVYRYRPDAESGDLTLDAAASNSIEVADVTEAMRGAVRQQYARDLAEWPWQKGAPFVDKNSNGRMDQGERPGLENASQLLWLSYNDLDGTVSKVFAGDPPIGLEVQLAVWAYHLVPNLEDIFFKRYRLIYRGTSQTPPTARIDSMYLTQWFDPDIGRASDDVAGCDSVLGLGYGYNAIRSGDDQDTVYESLHLSTPGIAYAVLQGPLVPASSGESGFFGFKSRGGSRNLPMTACVVHITGAGDEFGEPGFGTRSFFYWNISRGCRSGSFGRSLSNAPILDPNKRSTKFMFYGDPGTRSGWTALRPLGGTTDFIGGDPRVFMSMGPFSMALGDTQEVVIAVIASPAPTMAENISWLKNRASYVRALYPNLGEYVAGFLTEVAENGTVPTQFALDQNFPNPFNPSTRIQFMIPAAGQTLLTLCDILGREIRVLVDGSLSAGRHAVVWDGRDSNNQSSPSGIYFYRLKQGARQATRKLLLLR